MQGIELLDAELGGQLVGNVVLDAGELALDGADSSPDSSRGAMDETADEPPNARAARSCRGRVASAGGCGDDITAEL